MPSIKVTTTKTEAKVTVDETQAVIAITESPVEIVAGTSGPQGATGVVQAVAPITYDLQNASVGINIGQNLETSANTLKVTDDLTAIDSIAFDTAAGETSAVGKIVWNDTEGTLEFGLKGGNVTLQIGQEQVVHVRNNTGSTLLNGQAVYITSANAGQINVTLASNDTEANSSKTLGILTEDIPNGQQGYCTTQGLVRGLNTSHLTEGATIWLGTNGNLTTTRPTAPANSVVIGVCVSQSNGQATNGIIFVRVINGFELDELHNVLISSPADNQVLTYEASSGLWKNKTNPADGVTSITASSPLTGGTITSTGTIGLDQTALSIQPSQVAGTAVITTDSRLSDARTPTAHASSHASAGSDPVTLAQSQVTNLTTDLDSKTSASLINSMRHMSSTAVDVRSRELPTTAPNNINGTVWFTFFTPIQTTTVSQVTMIAGNAQVGATLVRMGLYTFDETTATLVARTANDTTILSTTSGIFTRSFDTSGGFPATYTLQAGQRYAFAFIVVGATTVGQFYSVLSSLGLFANLSPRTIAIRGSQTDLPLTNTTFGVQGLAAWARFS